jgi:hypothetical protein
MLSTAGTTMIVIESALVRRLNKELKEQNDDAD